MNASLAVDLLYGELPGSQSFANMVRALQMHPWLNSDEQTARLEAALWARKHSREVHAEADKRRNMRLRARSYRRAA